ncbi:hypothetical protein LTR66_007535 [Elasticomyces elasticus]|nr:hypothetical protein LTR66_007535 [Elasticomyces elasticus]
MAEPLRTGREQQRRTLSRTTSQRRRSRSRPLRTSSSDLQRIYSAGHHLDDHSVYHHDHAAGESDTDTESEVLEEKASDSSRISDSAPGEKAEEEEEDETIPEILDGLPAEQDVEVQRPPLQKRITTRSIKDPNLVTWDGPDDPGNPKNWSMKRKWAATLVVSSFTFISPVSSSMVAPALTTIARDLYITSQATQQLVLSIFILAYAIGPLFFGPLSEIYGRVPVLQLANLFYLVWNLGCGFAKTEGEMMAFRFLAGLGGSAPLSIGGGLLSDCWRAEERGRAISVYSLAPLLGPAIGPIAGGFVTQKTTWRWVFYATTIADACIQVFGLFFLQETYVPKILRQKRDRLRKETGNMDLRTEYDTPDKTFTSVLSTALIRPFRLLGTQPIVQVLAVYIAYVYGLMYLVLSTFPRLWTEIYYETIGIGGLNYISLGLGFFSGTQVCAPLNDRIYRRLKNRNNGVGKPEFRIPLMMPASLVIPIGLFWYGWSAQAGLHWIMPNIGAFIFSFGNIVVFQCVQTYVVDAYQRYAASAVASTTVLRSLAGFGFPLFALPMYRALGDGWGNSLLGFVALGIGLPAPFLLWYFGERLRMRSKFAAGP